MIETNQAGTPSSTTATRLRVPVSKTTAMPTETWKRASRSSRGRGNSAVAASAKGSSRGPSRIQVWIKSWVWALIGAPVPGLGRYKSR